MNRARNLRYQLDRNLPSVEGCCTTCTDNHTQVNSEFSDVLGRFASGEPLIVIQHDFTPKSILYLTVGAIIAVKIIKQK